MSEQPFRRRASDFDPEDHDLLIELRTEMRGLNQRIDSKMGDFQSGLSALRTETVSALTRFDERITPIERWKNRLDGAAFIGREGLALSFAGGALFVALVGLVLKQSGHL